MPFFNVLPSDVFTPFWNAYLYDLLPYHLKSKLPGIYFDLFSISYVKYGILFFLQIAFDGQ